MGMTLQRAAVQPSVSFSRAKDRCDPSDPQLGETRTYFDGLMFRVTLSSIEPGHEQPWHRHDHTVEWVYVLQGELTFAEGPSTLIVGAGDAVLLSPSNADFHTMRNEAIVTGHYLTVKAPMRNIPEKWTDDRIIPT